MTPRELVFHAKEMGLSGLSITDHDNVRAYFEAVNAAQDAQIWLGTGVEFSSVYDGKSVHILGYDLDIEASSLLEFCDRHVVRRRARNHTIIEKLSARGMDVDGQALDALLDAGVPVGRPHIALQLLKRGHVESVQQAFDELLGDGRPCFDPGMPISSSETIDVIHRAGGKAFLAHPFFLKNSRLISNLLLLPFDGIECYYSRFPPYQEAKWVRIAKERNLLISGGSDFHGVIKPMIPLGCSWVNEQTFDLIFERHRWKF